jgi:predicted RNA-binding Zn-ribbon protein involved in translation (DUF1610 family)
MAKKQSECGNCGKKHFTNIIKVYVVKSRSCVECKVPTFCDVKSKTFTCPKCGKITEFKDTVSIAQMPVKIVDVTMEYLKRDAYVAKGFEINKREEPEKQVCVKCEHLRKHIET